MKKVLVVHNFYREFGGEDSNIYEEIEFLKSNYEISFYEEQNLDSLNIQNYFSFISLNNSKTNRKLKTLIKEFKPEIIYVHNTWFKINLGIFNLIKKSKIKVVLKIHNFRYKCADTFSIKLHLAGNLICPACGIKKNKRNIFNKYYQNSYIKSFFLILFTKKLNKIILNNNIKLIAISEFHKKNLIKHGFNKDNIFVIHNPINLNINPNLVKQNTVVYAGRIIAEKGVEELLYNWSLIKNNNYKLLIIGEGNLKNKLELIYSSENIKFLGFLSNNETKRYINNSKAVITATKLYEGQPRLLSEASSQGVISIYPSFGGMDEFFPINYEFRFEQFNYIDMIEKIKLLDNKNLVLNTLKELNNFNCDLFDSERNFKLYEKVF